DVTALTKHLQGAAYDIVSSIDTEEAFPAMHRLPPGGRLVLEIHSPYRENVVYLRWLDRLEIAAFLVPSFFQASVARARLGPRAPILVVPNPLRARFAADPDDFIPRPPKPVVAWIGRLDRVKNWPEFLKIAAAVAERMPGIEVWVAGKADHADVERRFLHRAQRLGLLGRLRWFRDFPHEQMPRLLDAVRDSGGVVVSTSRFESFGMTVAEAMARGCAVVVPELGPFGEFVTQGKTGFLYPPGSTVMAERQIEELITDSTLRVDCGRRAREAILARHSPDRAIPALVRVMADLVRPSSEAASRRSTFSPAPAYSVEDGLADTQ
ncbi:MAG TPA: glycosyltransferase family 4 protein, partial [Anaerolineales bacterium]|nr:glycosyltransferase family 4 protein [Anaerolineales bacterium]